MTYLQALRYLESFINYEKITAYPYKESLRLERIKGFLAQIGNPQDSLRCIHVAGSKGKGSVCAFLTYILRQAGYKTGLYTSPHLSDFRERIRILGHQVTRSPVSPAHGFAARRAGGPGRKDENDFEGMISRNDLAALTAKLKPYIEKYHATSKYGSLSFFEVYTALAFVYFKSKSVDFAVLETGLGGRLDATNTVDSLVSVITPISCEHTQKLGNTLKQIAGEKAGIIKGHNSIVVCAPQEKEALEVIRNRCKKVGTVLYEVDRDIKLKVRGSGFAIDGIFGQYPNLKIRLLGEHQIINAATAVGAIEALCSQGINVGAECLRRGLYNTVWPGRCEVVGNKPLVVLDGAQNKASAQVLRKAVEKNFKYKKAILVLGISDDKDIKGICKHLCPLADEIILTEARNPRAASVDDIEKIIRSQVIKTKNVKEAIKKALEIAGKEDLILVTGSLFTVGEARGLF